MQSDTNAQTSIRTRIIDEFQQLEPDELLTASYVPKSGRDKGQRVEHYYISPTIRRVIWLKDSAQKRGRFLFKLEKLGTYWSGFPLNNLTKEGGVRFPHGKKPEALVQRVLELATKPGEWVLDSFGGSGTTAAVAHKMKRRWITVELAEHCDTHIVPRLTRVISGEDQGGITDAVGWKGGGGFRYYRLGPSMLEKDDFGNWVISKDFNATMLAEAMCKLQGVSYAPSDEHFWMHGHSTETDFIYITTQFMTKEVLTKISDEVGDNRSLLICCSAFRVKPDTFPNLTLKKIPKAVLHKCQWGQDDYSLEIQNLPKAPDFDSQAEDDQQPKPTRRQRRKAAPGQQTLF